MIIQGRQFIQKPGFLKPRKRFKARKKAKRVRSVGRPHTSNNIGGRRKKIKYVDKDRISGIHCYQQ